MNRYCFDEKQHIHTLDGKPLIGTSTVVGVVAKPLTWWASGKAVETLGWTNPKKVSERDRMRSARKGLERILELASKPLSESVPEYLKMLDTAYRAHADNLKETASEGTDLHAELERFVKDWMHGGIGDDYDGKIMPFVLWAKENIKEFLWSELYVYSEKLWTGGIADVGWLQKDGKVVAGDFKSSREAYPTQFFQIAGYDLQLQENGGFDKDGNKILEPLKVDAYAVVPFGATEVVPQVNYATETNKRAFCAALELHKIINV